MVKKENKIKYIEMLREHQDSDEFIDFMNDYSILNSIMHLVNLLSDNNIKQKIQKILEDYENVGEN